MFLGVTRLYSSLEEDYWWRHHLKLKRLPYYNTAAHWADKIGAAPKNVTWFWSLRSWKAVGIRTAGFWVPQTISEAVFSKILFCLWNSRSVCLIHSGTCCDFQDVLCRARHWTLMILVVPFQLSISYGSMILLDFPERTDEKVFLSLTLSKIYLCSFQREPILYDLLSKDAVPCLNMPVQKCGEYTYFSCFIYRWI